MKISDLNKITITDLKNYDWKIIKDRLVKTILSNPKPIIIAVVIMITFAATSMASRIHNSTAQTKRTELKVLRERAEALDDLENSQKLYNDFLNTIPEAISESKLIEMLSDIALARNVQIVSLSPTNSLRTVYAKLTNIEITISSENYADTIRFMHDIENSPYPVRIGKWSGNLIIPTHLLQRYLQRIKRQDPKIIVKHNIIEAKIKIGIVDIKK